MSTQQSQASPVLPASLKGHYFYLAFANTHLRIHKRSLFVGATLSVLLVLIALFCLTLGDYGLSVGESFQRLLGNAGADGDYLGIYFVQDVRAPRVLGAILVGAALGLSGRLFQTVSGNPLGSPDIVGFSTGAATGAIVAIIVLGATPAVTALGAVIGGLVAGAIIVWLAGGAGVVGIRLVLIGIGVSAVLKAVNSLLLVKAPLEVAQAAEQWNAGSLHGITWAYVVVLAGVVVVCALALIPLSRPLTLLPLGEDATTALGISGRTVRAGAVLIGLVLVCLATAVAGPLSFVALASPHVAQRLTRTPGSGLVTCALTGAFLVSISDAIAQRIIAPAELAVGVITGTLGGIYLLILLMREYRRNSL